MTAPHSSPRSPLVASGLKMKLYRTLSSTRFLFVLLCPPFFLSILLFIVMEVSLNWSLLVKLQVSSGGRIDGWMRQSVQARPT